VSGKVGLLDGGAQHLAAVTQVAVYHEGDVVKGRPLAGRD
jgi:hypothetical protein